jgi:hypothetical protein
MKNKIEFIPDEDYMSHILCNFIQWAELATAWGPLILWAPIMQALKPFA